ncbi:MAG: GspH/FimT family pseudopilin [Gammaproteobacteria bacterium]|nr:GspH/FimT family pseudopilin [Gammaproteobacteria bacterium]MCP5202334.1 GspH/FimT family pseudopilin [Gammaproteobacteria bacterium]
MNAHRGFTIIELMTVVAVMALLVTIGLPNFQTMVANNRVTSQVNLFSSSLQLARSEAVKSNTRVVVCPSTTGTSCTADVDWNVGWISFIDRGDGTTIGTPNNQVNDNGGGNASDDPCGATAGDDASDDCILDYVSGLTPSTMTLESDASNDYVFFNGLGAINEAASFVLCDDRGAESARAVFVENTGRVSIRTTKLNGNALTCTP